MEESRRTRPGFLASCTPPWGEHAGLRGEHESTSWSAAEESMRVCGWTTSPRARAQPQRLLPSFMHSVVGPADATLEVTPEVCAELPSADVC
jgi:hypothetical protein